MSRRPRRGFALLTVMWILAVTGTVSAVAALEGRLGVAASTARVGAERARWEAVACLSRARAAIDIAVASAAEGFQRDLVWRDVSEVVRRDAPADPRCEIVVEPLGGRFDVNSTDSLALLRLILSTGLVEEAPALVDALLDWRDTDDDARANGAEANWYDARGRPRPSNSPLSSIEELRRIRGFEAHPELRALLTTEPAPVALLYAPRPVLNALISESPELVDHIVRQRESGRPRGELRDLLSGQDSAVNAAAERAYAQLSVSARLEPVAWQMRARATDPHTRIVATVEHRLRRSLSRVHVTRERAW